MDLLLVTCSEWPEGEPGAAVLDRVLAERGVDFEWVRWDDETVEWAAASLIAVRAPWDYVSRWQKFLTWAGRAEALAPMLNSSAMFAWNIDKGYLCDLGELPVVPTTVVRGLEDLRVAQAAYGDVVIKPRVGAGGVGLRTIGAAESVEQLGEDELAGCVVQPLVSSVRTEGETSVYVLGGRVVSAFNKLPDTGSGEVRVNEEYGGVVREISVPEELVVLSRAAVHEVERCTGQVPDYCRVDFLSYDGSWCVSELEVIEPGLYLDVSTVNAEPFVKLVTSRLRR